MNKVVKFRFSLSLGPVVSLSLVLMVLLLAASPGYAQSPIALRFSGDGNYGTVANGVGMEFSSSGTIPLTVPGTPVAAYFYWSGYDTVANGGDAIVGFSRDATLISSDIYTTVSGIAGRDTVTFGPNVWYGNLDRTVYMVEVTDYVRSGTHNYTISDYDLVAPGIRDGAGLVVVYEDPAEPYSRVIIQDGLSIFFPTYNTTGGPGRIQTFRHSDTACLDFPTDTVNRNLNYSLFVGGLRAETPPRTNALRSYTGSGASLHNETPPRNIIDVVDPTDPALGSQPPIAGSQVVSGVDPTDQNAPDHTSPTFGANIPPDVFDGDQWDTYTSTLTIPAGDTFACFQVQTFDLYSGQNGSSGNWMALIGRIPLPTVTPPTNVPPPTAVPTTVPTTAPTTVPSGTLPPPASDDPVVSKIPNPQSVVPGDLVTWQVTITNPTGAVMTNVRVTDPVDTSFFSAVISATSASSAVTTTINGLSVIYDIPQIQPGETLSLTLVVRTRSDLAPGTVGTNFVIIERPGRPPIQTTPVSLSMIRRLPETGYPPR